MRRLDIIVNADDLGAGHEINETTFDLMSEGRVTSATMMANGPEIEAACQGARSFPHCSFGVHLNVTEFRPLSDPQHIQPLLDGEGGFAGEDRIRQISIDSALAEGIYSEFCAQIERLRALGVPVSHLDSHHHVHTIQRVFPILKKVQKQFDIRKVRISRNIYAPGQRVSAPLVAKKAVYNFFLRHYYKSLTTRGFTDFQTFYEYGTSKGVKYRTVEVMVHPGSQSYGGEGETQLLRTPWQDDLVNPVRLISYDELG